MSLLMSPRPNRHIVGTFLAASDANSKGFLTVVIADRPSNSMFDGKRSGRQSASAASIESSGERSWIAAPISAPETPSIAA